MQATPPIAGEARWSKRTIERYRRDWVGWARKALRRFYTPQQEEVVKAIQRATLGESEHRRFGVASGHGCGKTLMAADVPLIHACLYRSLNQVTSSTMFQVRERLFAEFRRTYRRSAMPLGGRLLDTQFEFDDKWGVYSMSTNESSNFQGGHERHVGLVFDEAQAVEKDIWDGAEGMLSSPLSFWLTIYNPLFTDGPAYEAAQDAVKWRTWQWSCLDHPNVVHQNPDLFPGAVSHQWVEEMRRDTGGEGPLWEARVLGQFPSTSERTLLTLKELERTGDLTQETLALLEGIWIGVDVARFGSDSNYICVTNNGRLIYLATWRGIDLMQTVGNVVRVIEDFSVPGDQVNVDGNGLGGGVVDRLRELKFRVNDVQFGGSAESDQAEFVGSNVRFRDRKAELYWAARCRVQQMKAAIPRKFASVWSDLAQTRYLFNSNGDLYIEDKETMRKRVHRSPDAGDAFAISLSRTKQTRPSVSFA